MLEPHTLFLRHDNPFDVLRLNCIPHGIYRLVFGHCSMCLCINTYYMPFVLCVGLLERPAGTMLMVEANGPRTDPMAFLITL